jgi:hypothetical protein
MNPPLLHPNSRILVFTLFLLALLAPLSQATIPNEINLQGALADSNGNPIAGTYAYQISFFNSAAGGSAIQTATGTTTLSSGGRFSITVAPSAEVLSASQAWYELGIDSNQNGFGPEDVFPDRAQMLSVPFSLRADQAVKSSNSDLFGGLAPASFVRSATLDTLVWSLAGNSGTMVPGDFLGTTDNKPFEVRVNNLRAFRFEPDAESPNLIGGNLANQVQAGARGATIGGGGSSGLANQVLANYGTVAGGLDNSASAIFSVISGGQGNTVSGNHATISGGHDNVADHSLATIGGGLENKATELSATVSGGGRNKAQGVGSSVHGGVDNTASSSGATVGGGSLNLATANVTTVGGGTDNQAGAAGATVAGGVDNKALGPHNAISGGLSNRTLGEASVVAGGDGNSANGDVSTIGGGLSNKASAEKATIAGGSGNIASGKSSTVAGGELNGATGELSFVGGGRFHSATGYSSTVAGGGGFDAFYNSEVPNQSTGDWSTIGGGERNMASGPDSTIGGGDGNAASELNSAIGGGSNNRAEGDSSVVAGGTSNTAAGPQYSAVGGGHGNQATGYGAWIGGGEANEASGDVAMVPGGQLNVAMGNLSFAAGRRAKALHHGAFVWADSEDADFASTTVDQFSVRSANGLRLSKNAEGIKTVNYGEHYRDNSIAAWGRVTSNVLATSLNVASVVKESTGVYRIVLKASAADAANLTPVVTAEVGAAPISAATARLVAVKKDTATAFRVYLNDGAFNPVNGDFTFIVTGR